MHQSRIVSSHDATGPGRGAAWTPDFRFLSNANSGRLYSEEAACVAVVRRPPDGSSDLALLLSSRGAEELFVGFSQGAFSRQRCVNSPTSHVWYSRWYRSARPCLSAGVGRGLPRDDAQAGSETRVGVPGFLTDPRGTTYDGHRLEITMCGLKRATCSSRRKSGLVGDRRDRFCCVSLQLWCSESDLRCSARCGVPRAHMSRVQPTTTVPE
ncbi:hypothetical protein NDU88_007545 [Pleurodeles waltl]|uniref:Uncharacterized protein n=1 Tax=Pleurodeles waltl TaxID=8319 RepID=A0AAV7LSC8_PLEWA|nr:hypothetical protein NDU88_007545 [Pleurodeles waltl]